MKEEQDSPEEQQAEGSQEPTDTKVSPEFQEQVTNLLVEATLPELEFIESEVADAKKKLTSSQKKSGQMTDSFSTEGMPQD